MTMASARAKQGEYLPNGVQPGHAALGGVLVIALAHCCGHQNGPQWSYISSSLHSSL